jgi:2'-5' RNA ligase
MMQANWFVALKAVCHDPLNFPPLAEGMHLLHPQDYHVTVSFFGKLDTDPTDVLADVLSQLPRQRLSATATSALLLPRPEWASVVALAFSHGNSDLCSFIASWRDQLRQVLGLPPESRSVLPHLTVVRMKPHRARAPERQSWATQLEQYLPLRFEFPTIGVYTWRQHFDPSHPRYRMTYWVELV